MESTDVAIHSQSLNNRLTVGETLFTAMRNICHTHQRLDYEAGDAISSGRTKILRGNSLPRFQVLGEPQSGY